LASDQLYWPSGADDETISRFVMASVMSGVPSVGANILELQPSALEIVRNWMGFYRTFKKELTSGRVRPFGRFQKPNHLVESGERIIAYVVSNTPIVVPSRLKGQLLLLNASDRTRMRAAVLASPQATYELQVFNRYVHPEGAPTYVVANRGGFLDLDAVVERGGFLTLTAQN
jgi:hypothetical protein